MRILVADDDVSIRRLLAAYLLALGHEVLEAADGGEAVTVALREKPGLVLLDVLMPCLDGYSAVARLRAAGFPGQLAVATALTGSEALPPPGAEPDALLPKPFRRADVARLMAELAGRG